MGGAKGVEEKKNKGAGSLFKFFFPPNLLSFTQQVHLGGVEKPEDGFNYLQPGSVARFSAGVWGPWMTGGHVLSLMFSVVFVEPGR